MKTSTLREVLEGWNTSLEKQAGQFVSMCKQVRDTDLKIQNYFTLLQKLEASISSIQVIEVCFSHRQHRQNTYKEVLMNIKRHQDQLEDSLTVFIVLCVDL